MTRGKVKLLRHLIEQLSEHLTDTDALEAVELFPAWFSGMEYTADTRIRFSGQLYRCLQNHTSQDNWTPEAAPSLWAKVLIPDPDVIPEWEQPDSTNPYKTGDKVKHNGKTWISIIDGNVWEPGVYGWEEVT